MELRTHEVMWLRDGPVYGTGRAIMHKVSGLPRGSEAQIANFRTRNHDIWRILQIKNGVVGHWQGNYSSVAEALTILESCVV